MHLNYHFLKFLCPKLEQLVGEMQVYECFSQNRDELIIGLSNGEEERYIRANLAPATTCLSFPKEFKRSKKNNVSLFSELIGERVMQVKILEFERAFSIHFYSGKVLLFKMHGTRSNILLFPANDALSSSMFRNELKEDASITIGALQNPLLLDRTRFELLEGNASLFPSNARKDT